MRNVRCVLLVDTKITLKITAIRLRREGLKARAERRASQSQQQASQKRVICAVKIRKYYVLTMTMKRGFSGDGYADRVILVWVFLGINYVP